jgi:hypothetical protein
VLFGAGASALAHCYFETRRPLLPDRSKTDSVDRRSELGRQTEQVMLAAATKLGSYDVSHDVMDGDTNEYDAPGDQKASPDGRETWPALSAMPPRLMQAALKFRF